MNRTSTLTFLFFLICILPSKAQLGKWAISNNYNGTDQVYDMHFSNDGKKIFVLGSGAIPTSGGGPSNPYYFYLARYDTSGYLDSALMPKALGSGFDNEAYSMAIDKQGMRYITGYFASSIQIRDVKMKGNGGAGADYFLARIDDKDSVRWIKGLKTTSGNSITGMAVDVDDSGYIYVTGAFGGKITIGSFSFNSSNRSTFFAKYDSSGNVLWAKSFGNYAPGTLNAVNDLSVEKNTATPAIYLVGSFSGKQVINGTTYNPKGSDDIIIYKFDASGNFIKTVTLGDKNSDLPKRLNISRSGKLLLTGNFSTLTTLGSVTLKGNTFQDNFIAVMDTALNVKWANSVTGKDFDIIGMASMDPFDNVFIVGEMRSSPTTIGTDTFSLHDFANAYLAKYDSTGKYLGAGNSEGYRISASVISYQSGAGIAIDSNANVYTSGVYAGNATFGDSNNILSTKKATNIDVFITKMRDTIQRCIYFKNYLTHSDENCHGDSSAYTAAHAINGLMPYSYNWSNHASAALDSITGLKAGKYVLDLIDMSGCKLKDSVIISEPVAITYSAKITDANGSKSGSIHILASGGSGSLIYQWKGGQTTADIDSLNAGTYYLSISDSFGCSVSDSFIVGLLNGIYAEGNDNAIRVYPNPAKEALYIQSEMPLHSITVFDMQGRKMIAISNTTGSTRLDISRWPKGIYTLIICASDGNQIRRIAVME